MIHVVATVTLNPGVMAKYLELLAANCVLVRAEEGCVAYTPARDVNSGIGVQEPLRSDTVVICEQWTTLEALHAHLAAPHMTRWRENVKGLVAGVKLQVMETVI